MVLFVLEPGVMDYIDDDRLYGARALERMAQGGCCRRISMGILEPMIRCVIKRTRELQSVGHLRSEMKESLEWRKVLIPDTWNKEVGYRCGCRCCQYLRYCRPPTKPSLFELAPYETA
jgi:hypothetical protein